MNLNIDKTSKILSGFKDNRVLVIGDIMMDAYYWGRAERISPEAPVPIVDVERTNYNPGGAGNVALNLSALGANVSLMAIIGNDTNGDILLDQLNSNNIDTTKIAVIDDYNTPIKTRVIAQDQQVIRIDQENNAHIAKEELANIDSNLKSFIIDYDGIILADYNKGLLSKDFISTILDLTKNYSIPVYVDPKENNFFEYKGVRLFKPNIFELKNALGNIDIENDIVDIGRKYLSDSDSDLLLITRGAKDALLFHPKGMEIIPTITQSVHDVSGAGDTVISTFILADLAGASPKESAILANIAASVVCSKVGVVPIKYDELQANLLV